MYSLNCEARVNNESAIVGEGIKPNMMQWRLMCFAQKAANERAEISGVSGIHIV